MKSVIHLGTLGVLLFFIINIKGYSINYDFKEESLKTTSDRVKQHGYPIEVHQLETEDNYVITLFRIPYSHILQNADQRRPVILLQHGLTASSDSWILNGPNDALAFLLADAGYDVWMGNARGNRYSRNNTRISPNHPYFWRFSWHEIAVIDMAAMIDYILETTGESSLHYTGHSQGTTVFFVLMSMRPEYNSKISTAHMLAPVAFMSNMTSLWAEYSKRFLGHPNKLTRLLDTMEVVPSTLYFVEIYETYCKPNPALAFMCSNLYYLITGSYGTNGNMNMTIADHLNETHPAGASSTQVLHYLQEYESGHFRQLDYGERENTKIYGRSTPPDYDVSQISANLFLYYADADTLCSEKDVNYLISLLPKEPFVFHVSDPTFTHTDFIFSLQVKNVINNNIIESCNSFENV